MHRFTALALLVLPAIAAAQKCSKDADCGKNNVCVIPDGKQGTCYPSCSLTSDARPCALGQACRQLPQISIMQTGYCPPPDSCGGFPGTTCKDSRNPSCVDDPRDDCNIKNRGVDCPSICVVGPKGPTSTPKPAEKFCGGIAGIPCPTGYKCVDNPNDGCDPKKGGADCGGICVVNTQKTTLTPKPSPTSLPTDQSCGGFTGKQCPRGYECVDNPKDTCDPAKGGADCPGLCVKERACGSRGLPACYKGEKCVRKPGCHGEVDCAGVCKKQ